MSGKKKEDPHVSLNSPVITIGKGSSSLSHRSTTRSEKSIQISKKPPYVSPNLLPYTPPDALMFALFSAIQRKTWVRARRLCHELILCDPWRKNYRDLYDRIDQIIRVINLRLRPTQPIPSRTTTASTGDTDEGTMTRRNLF